MKVFHHYYLSSEAFLWVGFPSGVRPDLPSRGDIFLLSTLLDCSVDCLAVEFGFNHNLSNNLFGVSGGFVCDEQTTLWLKACYVS